jgi:hypothetical protein
LASNSVKVNRLTSPALRSPGIENQIFRRPPDYFARADKKTAASKQSSFWKHFKTLAKPCFMRLALHLLNRLRCGLGCILVGGIGEKYDARARWICPQTVSRINKGGGGQLRLGRCGACGSCLAVAIKNMPVFPYLNLLVVTARVAWFNFRGWKKRR